MTFMQRGVNVLLGRYPENPDIGKDFNPPGTMKDERHSPAGYLVACFM